MDTEEPRETSGLLSRLEVAYVSEVIDESRHDLCRGCIVRSGQHVTIMNAETYLRQQCLVRMNDRPPKKDHWNEMGFFISSDIPPGIEETGLTAEEFVLYGLWEDDMEKKGRFPSLDEVNRYFDPAYVRRIPYFAKDRRDGFVVLNHRGAILIEGDYETLLSKLPSSEGGSRMVMAETEDELERITAFIEGQGMRAVRVERLNRTRKYQITSCGRIEQVYLVKSLGQHSALGEIVTTGEKTIVANGEAFIGRECLVRFDGRPMREEEDLQKSNFLTTQVSPGFSEGINPGEYIFYGLWEEHMDQGERDKFPTLDDVNLFYDPGKIRRFAYICRNKDKEIDKSTEDTDHEEGGVVLISLDRVKPVEFDLSIIMRNLPNGRNGSPLILAETEALATQAALGILKTGRWPIRLEALLQ
jgi:hypothetical protein